LNKYFLVNLEEQFRVIGEVIKTIDDVTILKPRYQFVSMIKRINFNGKNGFYSIFFHAAGQNKTLLINLKSPPLIEVEKDTPPKGYSKHLIEHITLCLYYYLINECK